MFLILWELDIVGKPMRFNKCDSEIFKPEVCGRYWILSSFLSLEIQLNYKKMILEGKIS
jgi:hypothetical protein